MGQAGWDSKIFRMRRIESLLLRCTERSRNGEPVQFFLGDFARLETFIR